MLYLKYKIGIVLQLFLSCFRRRISEAVVSGYSFLFCWGDDFWYEKLSVPSVESGCSLLRREHPGTSTYGANSVKKK